MLKKNILSLILSRLPTGTITRLVQWLKYYKTAEGKEANPLLSDIPSSPSEAVKIIEVCHDRWLAVKNGTSVVNKDFYMGRRGRGRRA